MFEEYDLIVVGSGFTGAVVARLVAENTNKKILVIDKRANISGNMYDYTNQHGIRVQKYGIHVFHTNKKEVFDFLSRFTEWDDLEVTCLSKIKNRLINVPFNFSCIDSFWSKEGAKILKNKLKHNFVGMTRVSVFDLCKSKDKDIAKFGNFLFQNDYLPYTAKQWGRNPSDIDKSILRRVKISISYDKRYFEDKYQKIPKKGFSNLFQQMFNHKNIKIMLSTDVFSLIDIKNNELFIKGCSKKIPVLYTGALDYLFNYKYGLLPYRTLKFRCRTFKVCKKLDAPFVVLPMHPKMTRMTEMKSITNHAPKNKTTIFYEYPLECQKNGDPYYPIISKKNILIYEKYKKEAKSINGLYFCGRLAEYKYYNMDDAIQNAFEVAKLFY